MSGVAVDAVRVRQGGIDRTHFLQDYGVYVGVAALILFNTAQNPNFLAYVNIRLQLVQVVPVAIVLQADRVYQRARYQQRLAQRREQQ